MQELSTISGDFCKNLLYVFTDIDDTITTGGKLSPEAYSALWELKKSGIHVVPVTGRPAGWCDFFVRMWPIAGVIGENGAFYFSYDEKAKKIIRSYAQTAQTRAEGRKRLGILKKRVLKEISGCAIAKTS